MRATTSSREHRLLAVAEGPVRQKPGRAEAAEVRNDHAVTGGRQQRHHVVVAVDVVRPPVQQDDRRTIDGSGVDVAHVEKAGLDLAEAPCLDRHQPTAATASRITSVTA